MFSTHQEALIFQNQEFTRHGLRMSQGPPSRWPAQAGLRGKLSLRMGSDQSGSIVQFMQFMLCIRMGPSTSPRARQLSASLESVLPGTVAEYTAQTIRAGAHGESARQGLDQPEPYRSAAPVPAVRPHHAHWGTTLPGLWATRGALSLGIRTHIRPRKHAVG